VDWVIEVFSPKTLEIIPLNTLENMSAEQGPREIVRAVMVFIFPLITSLWINECSCFMSSSDRRNGLAC
jgi:hypothetical protein